MLEQIDGYRALLSSDRLRSVEFILVAKEQEVAASVLS